MKISVIIPTYNRVSLLPRAVRSIPKNAMAEIIIIDDGSTDGTREVVAVLQKEDPRILSVSLPQNRGVNYARNRGIEKATGEWISFLDSDDEYVLGGFGIVNSALERASRYIDIVGFMTLREVNGIMESRGFGVEESWETHEPSYEEVLFKEHILGDIHYCIRRSTFAQGYKFAEYINGFESAFFAKLAKDGEKFLYINDVVDMRHSGGDMHLSTNPYKRWPRQFARAYREFVTEHHTMLSERPAVLQHFYRRIGKCMLLSGNPFGIFWLVKAYTVKKHLPVGNASRIHA